MNSIINFLAVLSFLFIEGAFAKYDYTKIISKKYPNFVMINYADFNKEDKRFISNKKPGLVIGDFNGDSIKDFAALIHSTKSQKYEAGKNSYMYHDGMLIICHGKKNLKLECREITKLAISKPYSSFLAIAKPQKYGCYQPNGKRKWINVKNVSIGWYFPERGGSTYIYQKTDKYLECVTSD